MEHWENKRWINIARLFSGMSRLDTTSTSAHLWSGWIIIFHHSQNSKFFNLRPCMAMLKRFCYQSYHQTGVTSCTVIIHPWCFAIFTGFHHCCPPLALRAATGTIVLNPCLGGSKTRCRHGELPVVQRKHRDFQLFHEAFPVTHHTTLRFRANPQPSSITKVFKHMSKVTPYEPSWNKKMTTSIPRNM